MKPSFSHPRHRRDWESYQRECRLAAGLDDPSRVAEMREMHLLYLLIQRGKSAEQLDAERQAERLLNAWHLNPRFRSLLAQAHGSEDDR